MSDHWECGDTGQCRPLCFAMKLLGVIMKDKCREPAQTGSSLLLFADEFTHGSRADMTPRDRNSARTHSLIACVTHAGCFKVFQVVFMWWST